MTTTPDPTTCFVVNPTSARKPHNDEAGYIAEIRNALSGGHTVIYLADRQGIDVDGCRYAVVCCVHGTLVGTRSLPDARVLMKFPEFCEACMDVEYGRPRAEEVTS